jgi:copper chaperone CopZ
MKRHVAWLALAVIGCGGSPSSSVTTDGGSEMTTNVVFNAKGAPVVEFEAPVMHCEACAATIVEALRDKPGVVDAKADPESKIVTVAIKEEVFEPETVIAAIEDAGFGDATLVEEVAPIESEKPADNAG